MNSIYLNRLISCTYLVRYSEAWDLDGRFPDHAPLWDFGQSVWPFSSSLLSWICSGRNGLWSWHPLDPSKWTGFCYDCAVRGILNISQKFLSEGSHNSILKCHFGSESVFQEPSGEEFPNPYLRSFFLMFRFLLLYNWLNLIRFDWVLKRTQENLFIT